MEQPIFNNDRSENNEGYTPDEMEILNDGATSGPPSHLGGATIMLSIYVIKINLMI